jgi:hypothetical protein
MTLICFLPLLPRSRVTGEAIDSRIEML